MTALLETLKTPDFGVGGPSSPRFVRGIAVALLFAAAALIPDGFELAALAIADAYLQVAVFVAATIAVLISAEYTLDTDLGTVLMRRRGWQVPAGALLGALPGCGGAIVAVTQYTRGALSFGGVVATLTSTMGDAVFLLLAREPATAGLVLAVSMVAGIVMGYVVDLIHGANFMNYSAAEVPQPRRASASMSTMDWIWIALSVPGLAVGIMAALQVEFESALVAAVGVIGGVLTLAMWVRRGQDDREGSGSACKMEGKVRKLVDDTNFVTAWVVFAFVGYELFVAASGLDLGAVFATWSALVPGLAIIVGFIPGCGPQIVTTSLYLDGAIPLSAQLGNAISNDGDALFPAIAKAPKAATLATLYSGVPAVIVAYGAYALGW